jgi:hypothetical protein
MRGRWFALVGVALLATTMSLTSCGDSSSAPPATHAGAATAVPTPSPSALAKSAVRSYYEDVNSGNYPAAWSHFSPTLRASVGGFSSWRSGYANTTNTRLISLRTLSATQSHAVEGIRLVGEATDACGRDVTQTFQGTWNLAERNGGFVGVSLDMSQVSGDELVTDSSACPPPPGTTSTTTSTTNNCDPNYVGACVPADASDVDCAGGSGDGPEYVGPVQVVGSDPYGLDADGDGYACEP